MKRRITSQKEPRITTRQFNRLVALRLSRLRKVISLALAIVFALVPLFGRHTIAKSSGISAVTITVNTLADTFDGSIADGSISLRDAISASPAGATIDFSVTGTISLALGEVIVQDRILQGPGPGLLAIDAHHASRVFRTRGTTTIAGMTITGGVGVGFGGGGIYNEYVGGGSNLTVTTSVITGNTAGIDFGSSIFGASGGGIHAGGDVEGYNSLKVINSTISNNTALREPDASTGNGGGIYGGFSDVTVDRSTISGNTAQRFGGGLWGAATLSNSTVSGNIAKFSDGGGGAYLLGNSMVVNSTISRNTSGGLVISGVVANSTVFGNAIGYGVTGGPTLLNSIVVRNLGADGATSAELGTINTGASRNNLIADAGSAGGLTVGVNANIVGVSDADLGVGPLADNGGPTQTHGLFSFSLAINAGDNSLVPNDPATGLPFTTDQTGASRVFAGGTVDIGAVELQGTPFPSTVVNTSTDDVAGNALTSLREAVSFAHRLGGTVTFDPTVFATPQTIGLVHNRMAMEGVTIAGPGAGLATVDAGGNSQIFINRGLTRISGLTFTGGTDGIGVGAIDNYFDGILTIQDSVISGNAASGIHNSGTLVVFSSTISDNDTMGVGGGIWVDILDSIPRITTIVNSTVSGNSAPQGGGIYGSGTVTIRNSTISGNSAAQGGGIWQTDGSLTIHNSIVAGNLQGGSPNDIAAGLDASSSYNVIGNALPAGIAVNGVNGNIVGVDPATVLGPLADNGGPTPTHTVLPGSPAINAGDPAFDPNVVTPSLLNDQRGTGFARVRGGRLDIGAFEVQANSPTISTSATAVTIDEGSLATNFGPFDDSDGRDTVTITASLGTVGRSGNAWVWGYTPTDGPAGPIMVTITATDDVGLTATTAFTLTVNNIAPTVGVSGPSGGVPGQIRTFTLMASDPSAADQAAGFKFAVNWGDGSSVQTIGPGALSGETAGHAYTATGTYSIAVTATDKDGLTGPSATISVTIASTVQYSFSGFFQPVDNLPMVNLVNAGQGVPFKFSLRGNKGLNIFASGYPASSPVACDVSEPSSLVEETVNAGGSSLSYDSTVDQYSYVWKTDKAWKGTCRILILRLADGTDHLAKFKFR